MEIQTFKFCDQKLQNAIHEGIQVKANEHSPWMKIDRDGFWMDEEGIEVYVEIPYFTFKKTWEIRKQSKAEIWFNQAKLYASNNGNYTKKQLLEAYNEGYKQKELETMFNKKPDNSQKKPEPVFRESEWK